MLLLGPTKFRRIEKASQGNRVEEHNFPYAPALLAMSYQCRGHEELRPLPPPAVAVPCPVEVTAADKSSKLFKANTAADKSLLKFSKLTQQR